MPRRVYAYAHSPEWEPLNQLATLGALAVAASVAVFVGNVFVSLRRGMQATDNPWQGATLEWATSSPPPLYNFARIPVIASRDPLWDENEPAEVVGLPTQVRSLLVTHAVDARPDLVGLLPEPSIWPFWAAIAVTLMFIGTIFTPWALVWGAIPVAITLTGWFWPKRGETEKHREIEVKPGDEQAPELRPIEARP
jgi:cytochrome c oxidase subunit I+III